MKNTAIVILNYNGRAYLERFLPSVTQHSGAARIIVADNASTDDSVEWLKNSAHPVETIVLKENKGYSGGYNEVLDMITAEFYVLLNSDVEVTDGWLTPLIELMTSNENIAAVQPKILNHTERDTFEYAGAGGGFLDKYGFPFCRGRIFNAFEKDTGQYDDVTDIFWASGACLVVRSADFHESGALDTDFFAHMEEIDLCWRMLGMGKQIVYNGTSTVYHVGGGTLNKSNPRKTYLNFRNGLSLLYKNLPSELLWKRMIVRMGMDMMAFLRFLCIFQARHAWAVIHAHFSFWLYFRQQQFKRQDAQGYMMQTAGNTIYPGSVVWEYYIKGKRRYPDLKKYRENFL